MIPQFPRFKSIELTDRPEVEAITRLHPPYSDFNFTNLWCYDTRGLCRLSMLHGNLVVQISDYITGKPALSFLGVDRVADTVTALLDHASEHGLCPSLRLVPEMAVAPLMAMRDGFVVEPDEDSFDYILSVEQLIALDQPALLPKRRKIEKLRREHLGLEIRQLNVADSQTADQILRLCERWRDGKGRSESEFATERTAIERCLSSATHFEFVTVAALLDGELSGFTINEPVHDGYYIAHFGKCDPQWRGLSNLLESETARFMRDLGCSLMNFQQDLGLPGLRRYKRSWASDAFLKKFSISRRAVCVTDKENWSMKPYDCQNSVAVSRSGEVPDVEALAFGRSLHLDFYNVRQGLCDDLAFCYDLLDELTEWLGMHQQAPPFIFRSPDGEFPDKAGLSGWVPLIESGISIHTLTVKNFITIDIYTCGRLDVEAAIRFLSKRLQASRWEKNYLIRGSGYHA